MTPKEYMEAARVPKTLEPQSWGLWFIRRVHAPDKRAEFSDMTILSQITMASLHQEYGETVMEDSAPELRRHLPIWMHGNGRVLVTGLGLGCVVRGLLANPHVQHIDVIEIEREIIDRIGQEFDGNPRVTIHHSDAKVFPLTSESWWDYAWHDLLTEGNIDLEILHAEVMKRFEPYVGRQGAWAFPRIAARYWPGLLGQPKKAPKPTPNATLAPAKPEGKWGAPAGSRTQTPRLEGQ
jgi:hypothetical protein